MPEVPDVGEMGLLLLDSPCEVAPPANIVRGSGQEDLPALAPLPNKLMDYWARLDALLRQSSKFWRYNGDTYRESMKHHVNV